MISSARAAPGSRASARIEAIDVGDVGHGQLDRREVDRHLQIVAGLRPPAGELMAGGAQHVLADPHDLAAHLGDGHEHGRRDRAQARMGPPGQRLKAIRPAGVELDDRLEGDGDLAPGDRSGQRSADPQPRGRAGRRLGVGDTDPVAAALGQPQRLGGPGDQGRAVDVDVGGCRGQADGDGHRQPVAAHGHRLVADRRADAVGELDRLHLLGRSRGAGSGTRRLPAVPRRPRRRADERSGGRRG